MSSQGDYKAFVSSTFLDLQGHRAHVIRALRKAGFFVDPMEDWTASADEPKEFSRQRLEGCHLCILLIARRRGHVPAGDTRSITQQEYDEAKRLGIDILPYVLDDSVSEDDWPWEDRDQVETWRADLFEHYGVGSFKKTPKTLDIAAALTRWVTEQGPKTALRLYLEAVKQEHGYIKFVSLPRLEDKTDAPIQHLYVEPAVAERAVSPDVDPSKWPKTTPILDALAKHKKLVLLGDPGSGKSTLTSWLPWQLAEHHETGNEWTERLGNLVPIPMIHRDLGIGRFITWEGLLERFAETPLGRLLTLNNLERLLRDGKALIILDGLDEIGNTWARADLRAVFWEQHDQHSGCRWLLTSRIVGYPDVCFDYHEQSVAFMYPFPSDTGETPPSGKTRITYAELRYVAPFDNPRVDRFAHNWFVLREQADHKARTQAGELLEAIRSDEATTKLGRIPNLLTMMALIFRVRARLPHGRALLYSEIAQAYLETIDGWRRILSRPETLPERRRWLARIGFEMQRKRVASGDSDGKELLATGDEVRGWVAAAMADGGREGSDEDAADFVDYLAKRSGLLLPRGQDQFAFLHLSFQEYFAAVFLQNQIASPAWLMEGDRVAAGAAKDDLQAYAGETVWRETLVFLVELVAASEQPMWLEPILDALFGQNFDGISAEIRDSISQSRTLLLARLAIDPHGGFSANRRQRAIDVCCGREVQLMAEWNKRQMGVLYSTDVLRVLIGAEPNERRTILPAIKEHIVAQKTLVLNLDGTRVSDVSSLSGLTWLQMLWLGRTGVSDVSCLSRLTSLQTLYLHCTDVSDVSGLSGLTSLQTLTLGDTSVSDVSCLSGLTSLQTLYLENTGVNDVSSLSGLTSLEKLYLHGTGVTAEQVAAFHEARKQRGLPACSVTH